MAMGVNPSQKCTLCNSSFTVACFGVSQNCTERIIVIVDSFVSFTISLKTNYNKMFHYNEVYNFITLIVVASPVN